MTDREKGIALIVAGIVTFLLCLAGYYARSWSWLLAVGIAFGVVSNCVAWFWRWQDRQSR